MNVRENRNKARWYDMRKRCSNKDHHAYKDYGGRGITLCGEWDNYNQFALDMGMPLDGYTLDRIDNDKGYSKDNCRWSTMKEQSNNRREPKNNRRWPGVTFTTANRKPFVAKIKRKGKSINLGSFICPMLAHEAYKQAKATKLTKL